MLHGKLLLYMKIEEENGNEEIDLRACRVYFYIHDPITVCVRADF